MVQPTSAAVPVTSSRWRFILVGLSVVFVLANIVRWGGTTRGGPLFVLGVALQFVSIAVFVGLYWWLFLSPLKNTKTVLQQGGSSLSFRTLFGALAVASGLMFSVGTLWDEVWHRIYGGFGDDFFWPPHMLLYTSIGIMAFFATTGLLLIAFRGRGSVRERFRREPLVGTLAFVCAYLILNAPVDELWHRIYGLDITAWSLPHISLFLGLAMSLVVAMPLLLSSLPRKSWQMLKGFHWREGLAILLAGFSLSLFLQIGTSEWEGIRTIPSVTGDGFRGAFFERPEWLYPVVVIALSMFIGNIAAHTLRRVGVATLVGLTALAIRAVAIFLLGGRDVSMDLFSAFLAFVSLLILDVRLWLESRYQIRKPILTGLAHGAVFLAVALPLIASTLVYPRVNAATLPGMVVWGLVMTVAASSAGTGLGGWLNRLGRSEEAIEPKTEARSAKVALAAFSLAVSAVVLTIVFAQAPVN
jgi:hypothetical protein